MRKEIFEVMHCSQDSQKIRFERNKVVLEQNLFSLLLPEFRAVLKSVLKLYRCLSIWLDHGLWE